MAARFTTATIADLVRMHSALESIAHQERSGVFEIGDGCAVFLGPDLFVNRFVGVMNPSGSDLDRFESVARSFGHNPAVEVSRHARKDLAELLARRGYVADDLIESVLVQESTPDRGASSIEYEVELITDESLDIWCDATAKGWGHEDMHRRLASDRYGRAAHLAQDPGLLLARASDRRVVGCSALAIIGDVAILGAMSTLPSERGNGVQAAMIDTRLELAAGAGCSLAVTRTSNDYSRRNLFRAGFTEVDTITTWTKAQDLV